MEPVTPAEARDLVINGLIRAIHGPTPNTDGPWPGNTRTPITVTHGQEFPDWKALNEALVDEAGNEVLRVNPVTMYGVGVLFPSLTKDQENELDAVQLVSDQPGSEQFSDSSHPLDSEPADNIGGEADEPSVTDRSRPRTLAMSFHIPADITSVTVTVSGARYQQLPVMIAGSEHDLWQRVPVTGTCDLHPGSSSATLPDLGGLTMQVGADWRDIDGGQRLVTVYTTNLSKADHVVAERCLFQSQLEVTVPEVLPYPAPLAPSSDPQLDLLYRSRPVRAVGHGTDATAERDPVSGVWQVRTCTLPVVRVPAVTPDVSGPDGMPYSVGMLDLAGLTDEATSAVARIMDDYDTWISEQDRLHQDIEEPRLREAARGNLATCREFAADMRAGWALVNSDPLVREAFCLASRAMNMQRAASDSPARQVTVTGKGKGKTETVSGSYPHDRVNPEQSRWRPFQVAFLLASLPPAIDPGHPRRAAVDIVWMPTGGGKTEAYLGLAAFTILWERLRDVQGSVALTHHVTVLMRYTYRLLTAQQVQRAAALMCAMELIRQDDPNRLGKYPFRIGAFLGSAATPNTRSQAVKTFDAHNRDDSKNNDAGSLLLAWCPWCGAQMGPVKGGVAGYRKVLSRQDGSLRVAAYCPDPQCPFHSEGDSDRGGLPVLEVDEDIYRAPPAFLIGTIDKFAQLAWRDDAGALFGLSDPQLGEVSRRAPAPALFIQDELHLISGPLGSLNALYEVALEQLCLFDGGHLARIVAATATTRNFPQQVLRVYGREDARLIPPPALDINDSFFARTDPTRPGKAFVAVCAPGFGSNVKAQLRTVAALSHAAGTLDTIEGADPDPWWTNLMFFSSRRALARQRDAVETSFSRAAYRLAQVSGLHVGRLTKEGRTAHRDSDQDKRIKEITAAAPGSIAAALKSLASAAHEDTCLDLCFATSMIEVGVDVPRLGLMTVMGQPKNYSQYIQVTGRVGRTDRTPGLVVVVLSPHTVRDRSHYESFTSSHERLYASVDPVSVTPFTPQALERGLAGALTSVLRNTHATGTTPALITDPALSEAVAPWRDRAARQGGDRAVARLAEELRRLARLAHAALSEIGGETLAWGNTRDVTGQLITKLDDEVVSTAVATWRLPLSMRSVDGESRVGISRVASSGSRQKAQARYTITDDEDEGLL